MRLFTILAVYLLFWVLSAFLIMPFGVRTDEEEGNTKIPGQADSAPANFRPGRLALRTTILSLVLMVLFYVNIYEGWVTLDDVTPFHPPAAFTGRAY